MRFWLVALLDSRLVTSAVWLVLSASQLLALSDVVELLFSTEWEVPVTSRVARVTLRLVDDLALLEVFFSVALR